MSQKDIRRGFEKHLNLLTPNISMAFENVSFKPVVNVPYQKLRLIPFDAVNPTFGGDYYREVGTFQIVLCYPSNTGMGEAIDQAELIKSHFKRSTTISENNIEIIIQRTPSIGAGFVDSDRYCVPIRIMYYVNECA